MKKLLVVLVAIFLLAIMACASSGGGDDTSTPAASAKAITAFSLNGVGGTINESEKTIAITMPSGTNVTALVATFTTTGDSVKIGLPEQISGTTANDFTSPVVYTVIAADTTTQDYTVTVTVPGTSTPFEITTTAFNPATATVGVGYGALQAVTATGGQMPYSCSASGLPSGMAMNSSSCAIYGPPTVSGTFNVTVTVTDSSSPQKTASKVLSLTVAEPGNTALNLTGTFSGKVTASNGTGNMHLVLTQTGNSISGYGSTFYQYPHLAADVLVAGTVNGATLTLKLTDNDGSCLKLFDIWITAATNDSIAGTYQKQGGCDMKTIGGSFAVTRDAPLTLAGALNATNLTWTTGGSAGWSGQTSITHDGVAAAQSGRIGNNQESWIQTTVNGPGTLTFWWKVSSDDFSYPPGNYYGDYLRFYVNGILQSGSISGEVNWQQKNWTLPAGTCTLRWSYVKDFDDALGSTYDAGWVDQVSFIP
jgi:hypothetical protein